VLLDMSRSLRRGGGVPSTHASSFDQVCLRPHAGQGPKLLLISVALAKDAASMPMPVGTGLPVTGQRIST
jgi:hypothetical protein